MPNSLAVAHAPPMRERRDIARSTGHALLLQELTGQELHFCNPIDGGRRGGCRPWRWQGSARVGRERRRSLATCVW